MNAETHEFSNPTSVIANTYTSTEDLTITVEILEDWIPEPEHMSEGAAGVDIRAAIKGTKTIQPNETVMVSTGLKVGIPKGFFGMLVPRSGLASKIGIVLANTVGIIDSDYRGELMVPMINKSEKSYDLIAGNRIAQFILIPYIPFKAVYTGVNTTTRGSGGFGSTGVE